MITFEHEGILVRFDDAGLDEQNPGLIHGVLRKGRFYEEPFLRYIRSLGLSGCYVDIGAHVGTHTIYFARVCGAERVHSFEPQPDVYARLEANVALNNLTDRVVLHQVALADHTGDVTLALGRQTHVAPQPRSGEPGVHVVPGRRLDDLVRDPVALIKIDVEGMEPAVLAGGRDLIRRSRPVIFAEAGTGPEYAAVGRVMRRLGYAPTGRSFNTTPTYEFVHVANPVTRWARHLQGHVGRMVTSSGARRFRTLVPGSARRRLRRWTSRRP